MAKVTLAPGFENLHGPVGKLPYRLFLGMNIVYPKPKRVRQPNTPAQRGWRRTFREGTAYAKRVSEDPATWPAYVAEARKRRTTASALATKDWLKPPRVTAIDLSRYRRHAGDMITVQAEDDFKVIRVAVEILADAQTVVEGGAATFDAASGSWKYTVMAEATGQSGLTVRATAWDRPGQTGTLAVTCRRGALRKSAATGI